TAQWPLLSGGRNRCLGTKASTTRQSKKYQKGEIYSNHHRGPNSQYQDSQGILQTSNQIFPSAEFKRIIFSIPSLRPRRRLRNGRKYLVKRVNAEMEQEEEIKNLKQADPECFAVPINPRSSDPGEEKDPGKVVKAERRLDAMMEVDRRSRPWRPRVRLRELAEKSRGVKAMQQLHHQIQGRSGGRSKLQDRDKRVRETQTYLEALEKKKEQAAASCTWRYMRNHAENIQAKEQRREEEEAAGGLNMRAEAERVKRGEESVISRLRTPAGESQRLTWQSKNERARSQNPRNQRTENGGENRKRQLRMEQVHCKERFLSMEGAESARAGTSQTEGDGGEAREKALRHAETITDKQIREHELSAIAKRREIFQQDT
uniref:Uncharacterized protein n=1 Tax=Seriola dumerili TaxID=41447 RepID=A0A3B4USX8_SERDU